MSADFWAGYVSGAIGILVGNPLDLIKTRIQAGNAKQEIQSSTPGHAQAKYFERWSALARGSAAPILGYGALNALLFMTYNRSLAFLNTGSINSTPENPSAWSIWTAGALGGLATFFVSAPTELVKCRAQVSIPPSSSVAVLRDLWKRDKLRGLYLGGGITSVRDAVGYGFYFWSYELSKRAMTKENETQNYEAMKVLLCGGLAGVVTWASIFPLDVIKTRVQTWDLQRSSLSSPASDASRPLLESQSRPSNLTTSRPSTFEIARQAYRSEGAGIFVKGLGICSVRAFIVNAVQWATYEWMMKMLGTR